MNRIVSQAPLFSTVHQWLKALGIRTNTAFVKEQITTHPDYPAIISVADFLDAGNMQYKAVEADVSYIKEFNYPLIAHINSSGGGYMQLIHELADWDRLKEITEHWSGVVFFPEKNANWSNTDHENAKRVQVQKNIFAVIAASIGLGLFAFTALQTNSVSFLVFGFFALIGLVISFFILNAELGFQNTIVKQVCGAVSAGGCEKVLNSKHAKSFLGFTPADLGLIYFTTQFFCFLASPYSARLGQVMYAVALIGLPVAALSLYTQSVILKQYCALCLGLVVVLLVQAGLSVFNFSLDTFLIQTFASAALLFASLGLVLFPIKNLLNTNEQNKRKANELRKWKSDATIFNAMLQQQQQVDTTIWEHDLILGNPNALILITVACNPYCGPCEKAHEQVDDLLNLYPNEVAVQLRLMCNPENLSDPRTVATAKILVQSLNITENKKLKDMLTDWFHLMDLEKWEAKWPALHVDGVQQFSQRHDAWMKEAEIRFTPKFFVNGKMLPNKYTLTDLKNILPDFILQVNPEKILQ